jgi:hypothetical protein
MNDADEFKRLLFALPDALQCSGCDALHVGVSRVLAYKGSQMHRQYCAACLSQQPVFWEEWEGPDLVCVDIFENPQPP